MTQRSRGARLIEVRPKSERLSDQRRHLEIVEEYPADVERPKTRADCANVPRPCPFVSCQWNLYLEVSDKNGSLKFVFPHIEPHEMAHSCALDEAEAGPHTLESVGDMLNMVRERVRQIESSALESMKRRSKGEP